MVPTACPAEALLQQAQPSQTTALQLPTHADATINDHAAENALGTYTVIGRKAMAGLLVL